MAHFIPSAVMFHTVGGIISYRGIACSYCTRDWIILSAGLVHTDKQDGFILTRVIIDTSLLRIRNDAVAPDAAQLILPLFGTDGTRYKEEVESEYVWGGRADPVPRESLEKQ